MINEDGTSYSSDYIVVHYQKVITKDNGLVSITKHVDSSTRIVNEKTADKVITDLIAEINRDFGYPSIDLIGQSFTKSFTGEIPSIASVVDRVRISLDRDDGGKEVHQYDFDYLTLPNNVPVDERNAWALALLGNFEF